MSGLSSTGEYSDVLSDGYATGSLTANDVQQVAKASTDPLPKRELLYIENTGNNDVYYGPAGVTPTTGAKLAKKGQFVFLPISEVIPVYVICATGLTSTLIIQEFA